MSCGVGCRHGSDPALLWLWHGPAAAAQIRPLAWELPYASGVALKWKKKKKKKRQHLKGTVLTVTNFVVSNFLDMATHLRNIYIYILNDCTCIIWKFLGQGLKSRFLTNCTTAGTPIIVFKFLLFFLCLFRAAPVAYGGSQARSLIRATAAGLWHSHSNARSELCARPTSQPMATRDP